MFVKYFPILLLYCNGAIGLQVLVNEVGPSPSVVQSTLAPTQTKIITLSPTHQLRETVTTPSPTHMVQHEDTEMTSSPTYMEKNEDLSTFSPTSKATSEQKSSEYFNYDPYSNFGPDRW